MCEEDKNKGMTPSDDITIEFIDHEETAGPEREAGESSPRAPEPPRQVPVAAQIMDEKLKAAEERNLRLRADFENFRKRADKESAELQLRTQMEILKKLLPFFDNIERAFESVPGELHEGWVEGLTLSLKDLQASMQSAGLQEMEAHGQAFDPAFHESLGFEESEEAEEGSVTRVIQKGYLFKGKLLRPARVFINRKSKQEERADG